MGARVLLDIPSLPVTATEDHNRSEQLLSARTAQVVAHYDIPASI